MGSSSLLCDMALVPDDSAGAMAPLLAECLPGMLLPGLSLALGKSESERDIGVGSAAVKCAAGEDGSNEAEEDDEDKDDDEDEDVDEEEAAEDSSGVAGRCDADKACTGPICAASESRSSRSASVSRGRSLLEATRRGGGAVATIRRLISFTSRKTGVNSSSGSACSNLSAGILAIDCSASSSAGSMRSVVVNGFSARSARPLASSARSY